MALQQVPLSHLITESQMSSQSGPLQRPPSACTAGRTDGWDAGVETSFYSNLQNQVGKKRDTTRLELS